MRTTTIAGVLLIAVPLAFNAAFALVAARFDYPDILRQPTADVLSKFRAGGTPLVLTWWAFALTAVLLAPLVVVLSSAIDDADPTLLAVATTVGVLAALVQFLGLVRWPFLVPYLARTNADPDASAARREAVDIVFQAFNRYLGVAVGEHLGYALTGAWTTLAGIALTQTTATPSWLGVPGIIIGPILMLCSLEFVGAHEHTGWRLAERLTPITYIAWSLWLTATGVALLASGNASHDRRQHTALASQDFSARRPPEHLASKPSRRAMRRLGIWPVRFRIASTRARAARYLGGQVMLATIKETT